MGKSKTDVNHRGRAAKMTDEELKDYINERVNESRSPVVERLTRARCWSQVLFAAGLGAIRHDSGLFRPPLEMISATIRVKSVIDSDFNRPL